MPPLRDGQPTLRYGFQANTARENETSARLSPGSTLSQAEINTDLQVDPDLYKKRRETVTSDKIPPSHIFGGTDVGDAFHKIAFDIGDILFMQKQVVASNGMESMFPVKGSVMAFLNGHFIDGARHGISNAKFARQFKVMGISNSSWTPPSMQAMSNKISVRVAGSGTTYNNGTTEIFAGDEVQWTLNSIDRDECKRELQEMPDCPNRDKTKLGAVLVRRSYESNMFLEEALDKSFNPNYAEQSNHFTPLVHRDLRSGLDDDIRVGIALKGMLAFFAAVAAPTFVEYGLMQFVPNAQLLEGAVRDRTLFTDAAKQGYETLLTHLGFGHSDGGHVNLLETLTCRGYRGMLSEQAHKDEGSLTHLLPPKRAQGHFSRLLNEYMDETQAIDRIHSAQQYFGGGTVYRLTKMLAMQQNANTCFIALNHSLPASRLEYLLRIH